MLARLISTYAPTHISACWDEDWRPQWRVDLLPSYKTHRVAGETSGAEEIPDELEMQVPMIVGILTSLGMPIVGASGFEADDVCATVADSLNSPTDVVTGDRDLFQLVDDARGVRVLYTGRGMANLQEVDEAWVLAHHGVPARAYADFAALRGDSSDGIPGVRGIGEKSAAALIAEFGSLEGIIGAALDPESSMTRATRTRLNEAADYLAVAGEVVCTRRDVPLDVTLDDLRLPRGTTPEFEELAAELGLGSSAERLRTALEDAPV